MVAQNEPNFALFTSWNGGIINPLFDGLTYNTSGHFAHCSYFSVLDPTGLGKILRNSQNIRAYYMLNHRIRCIYWLAGVMTYNLHLMRLKKPDLTDQTLTE